MKDSHIVRQIKSLILPLLEAEHVDLIDVELKGKPGNQVLRIFIDRNGGIAIGDCQELSRGISDILDMKNLIAGKYRLEVSSPGLDRPLKLSRDFQRQMGRTVRVVYAAANGGEKMMLGKIVAVQDDLIAIEAEGERIDLKLSQIVSAKIVPVW